MKPWAKGLLACFTFLIVLTGCDPAEGPISESGTDGDVLPGAPQFSPDVTVCNPWGDESTASNRGIVARLAYMPPGVCTDENGAMLPGRPRTAFDYLDTDNIATAVDVTIFFSRLFVPTRFFDRGFETQDGTLVLNANGNTLYEWFGVELLTQLKLAPNDEPGDYQLAILSDDGAVVYLNAGGEPIEFINNDGEHPTKMGCADEAITMTADTKIPIKVQYYQGPRYHISLVMMWRKMPTAPAVAGDLPWEYRDDSGRKLCGMSSGQSYGYASNTYYFTSGSSTEPAATPTAKFYEMLANGWKVLDNQNYALVDEVSSNPCTPPEDVLTLSDVVISNVLQTSADIAWSTNIASDSEAIVKNVATGAIVTFSNVNNVTSHSLNMTGLTANTLYSVTVVSQTSGGQVATSSEFAFRTRR